MTELKMIPLDLIDASLHNPRRAFDDVSLQALAHSIARLGVLQPILITERSENGRYEIVAGERRWRASRLAQKTEIPALVVELDDPLLHEVQLIENLEREQLNPIEEALAFKSLQEYFTYTDVTLAQRLKRSTQFIRSRLDLLKLHPAIQQHVTEERITIGAALEIGRIEEAEAQLVLAEEVVQGKLTALETTARVNRYKYEKRLQATRLNKKLNLERREQALATQGTVVTPESYIPERHHRVWDLMFK
jgi:ParB family chromosome partitioning protein